MRWRLALDTVLALAILVLVVTSAVRVVANALPLHTWLFGRYDVSQQTAIAPADLAGVARQVRDYLSSGHEPLQATALVGGVPVDLFGPAEAAHMADVKRLFRRAYRAQAAAAAIVAIAVVVAFVTKGRAAAPHLARWARRGALLTAGVILALGLGSVVAFDQLFTAFHYLGFPQGNWLFDPGTDYLVRIYPFGFWRDITLAIGGLTLGACAVLYAGGWWAGRRWPSPAPRSAARAVEPSAAP